MALRLSNRFSLRPIAIVCLNLALLGCDNNHSTTHQGYIEGEFVYIASPIAGRLDQLMVHRGQNIADKTPLFALESVDEKEAFQQSLETMKAAVSQLADLKTGKRPPELDVIRAQIAQAIADEQKSAVQLKRDEEQFAAGGIPKSQLDNSRYMHDADVAKVNEMKNQLVTAKLPARDDQIRAQIAQVAAAKASIGQAQWRLDQKSIFSTRAGLVFDTLFREGEWVPAGSPIVQMLPPQNIKVRFFVPEQRLGGLKLGQLVKIRCDSCQSDIEAHITYISNQSEYTPPVIYSNETRNKLIYMIEAHPSVENAPLLHPGQPVEVTVI